jgi:hypothetical protein
MEREGTTNDEQAQQQVSHQWNYDMKPPRGFAGEICAIYRAGERARQMSYQLSIERKPDYLHARVTGENTAQNVRAYMEEIRTACWRLRCPAVLIEEHLTGPSLSLTDIFGVAQDGSRPPKPEETPMRIGYVDTNPEHSHADMQFAETVATNRGLNVRVFRTTVDAQGWLAGT